MKEWQRLQPIRKRNGANQLPDALRNAIPYMTPEEIRETLFRALDRLDELYVDRIAREELLHKEREAHSLEVRNLKAELGRKLAEKDSAIAENDIRLAEKNNRIAALEQELAESKAARVDAEHKVNSMNQDKFQGTTKKA